MRRAATDDSKIDNIQKKIIFTSTSVQMNNLLGKKNKFNQSLILFSKPGNDLRKQIIF